MRHITVFFILLMISIIIAVALYISLKKEEQKKKVLEWLKGAVTLAEQTYGGGTGAIKLRVVYADFVKTWPQIAEWMPFSVFSDLVDIALEGMKTMIDKNPAVKALVKGGV